MGWSSHRQMSYDTIQNSDSRIHFWQAEFFFIFKKKKNDNNNWAIVQFIPDIHTWILQSTVRKGGMMVSGTFNMFAIFHL